MINRLIDMNPIITNNSNIIKKEINGNTTIEEYALAFIDGMSENQKNRFKKMLENNIECGMSVAENYGIDYDKFIKEVKKILNVEV